jgi:group I intron endonuclease
MPWIIYKITNILNQKVYIGQTKRSIKERWRRHIWNAEKGNLQYPIHHAIRKYGKNNFTISEIDNLPNQEEADKKEEYWIDSHNSLCEKHGYNVTLGKNGNTKLLIINSKYRSKNKIKIQTNIQGKTHPDKQFVGANYIKSKECWAAKIKKDNKEYAIYGFKTELEALIAYDKMAILIYKDKVCRLNFPNTKYTIDEEFINKVFNKKLNRYSQYDNVVFRQNENKWGYQFNYQKVNYHKFSFKSEKEAYDALILRKESLGIITNTFEI